MLAYSEIPVCEVENRDLDILGAVSIEYFRNSNVGLIGYLVTSKSYQNIGLAKQLMQMAQAVADRVCLI